MVDRLGLLSFLLSAALLAGLPKISEAAGDRRAPPPTINGAPVEVTVQFQVLDFARVNSRDESFDVTGYLELTWTDPRLAFKNHTAGQEFRSVQTSDIWIPRVYFANALDQPRDHGEPEVEVDSAGHVTLGDIISGKFSAELSLQSFPFDQQRLPIRLGAYVDRSQVVLTSSLDRVTLGSKAFLTDWSILGISVHPTDERFSPDSEPYSFLVIETAIVRKWTFYVWRVLIPMTLLVIVSWTVLWMDPSIVAPQATTAMGTLISLVAFNFAIDFAMPKVGYLTFIDRHALLGLTFVAAIVIEIAAAHHCIIKDRAELGRRIQRTARWLIPACYTGAVAVEMLCLLPSA